MHHRKLLKNKRKSASLLRGCYHLLLPQATPAKFHQFSPAWARGFAHLADKSIRYRRARNEPTPTKAVRPMENRTLRRWTCLVLKWTLRIFRLPKRLLLLFRSTARHCGIAEERRRPARGFGPARSLRSKCCVGVSPVSMQTRHFKNSSVVKAASTIGGSANVTAAWRFSRGLGLRLRRYELARRHGTVGWVTAAAQLCP